MMKTAIFNMQGTQVDEIDLSEKVFGIEPRLDVMHQAFVRQQANARQGTASTQTRGEVSRTGAKVWRQKGTGRARQGSRRAPQWVGGGVVFGPKPRDYTKAMPKKMRRLALRSALSAKAQSGQLVIVDDLVLDNGKTKEAAAALAALGVERSAVVLTGAVENDREVSRAFYNLKDVKTLHWRYLNIRDLLGHEKLIMPLAALRQIEALWG
ncbi:MAG: 50S ribosomal protein L4 [Ardenticatenales bacterium]|nr:50S ribosomal protein L4 [Ardenticatenales bacterium]MCB9171952.1 50S ribosomal protein L4 [Ardenticatenales bacterium]